MKLRKNMIAGENWKRMPDKPIFKERLNNYAFEKKNNMVGMTLTYASLCFKILVLQLKY